MLADVHERERACADDRYIIQAVIFLFFAAQQFLSGYRQKLVIKSAQEELAAREKASGERSDA